MISESARLPGVAQSDAFAAINLLAALVGALLVIPPLVPLFRQCKHIGVALAVLGTPPVTLLAGGAIFALVSGRSPTWQLVGIGAAGAMLVVMAARELGRDNTTASA